MYISFSDSVPTMLTKMEYAIRNTNLCEEVLDQALVCYKEEWMK